MDYNSRLDKIIGSLQTVNRIKEVYVTNMKSTDRISIKDNQVKILCDMLNIIVEQNDKRDGGRMRKSLEQSSHVLNTYHELKSKLKNVRNNRISTINIRHTLDVLKPVLNTRNRYMVEKAIKIYDILNS